MFNITKSLCCVVLCSVVFDSVQPKLNCVDCQGPLSMTFSRQEYWSGQPFPTSGYLPDPGIKSYLSVSCPGRQILYQCTTWEFSGKEFACSVGDVGLISGSGRFPGEGNGNPLRYSYLGNPMNRRAQWAKVHGFAESDRTYKLSNNKHLGVLRGIQIKTSEISLGCLLSTKQERTQELLAQCGEIWTTFHCSWEYK